MKLIPVIIAVFTITSAIRVPTSWPKKQNAQRVIRHKFRPVRPVERSEIGMRSQPHVVPKYNKINIERKYQPYNTIRHPNPKNQQSKNVFKASAYSNNDWRPVFPAFMMTTDNTFLRDFKSPVYKNYRDDSTHEPNTEIIREKHIHKETPLSPHEVQNDVPTRPIYPGEGQWAKRGKVHKPYINKHKFAIIQENEDEEAEEEKKPDGYDIFDKNKKLFEKKDMEFKGKLQEIPEKHNLGSFTEPSDEAEESEEDDNKQEFVPTKLYAQVRRSENSEHLPRLPEDPRLREVIKDSKIQTVYTEEGYEDIAYDHAGHEKNAEESEGFAEFDKEIEKEKQRQAQKIPHLEEIEEDEEEDSQTAGSHHHIIDKPYKIKKGNLMKTEETKTTSVKNKNGNSELEISSEVKILETPSNGKKAHRYVKIFPKVYRYDIITPPPVEPKIPPPSTTQVPDLAPMESTLIRRRFKRFTNDFPKITVDTDFIDKINHDIPQIKQKFEKPKYPYYNDPSIHPDSPLRYAEDLGNIPKKTEDELAFYHQADKIECPQVEDNVDPIPARVKDADADPENMEESTDIQELVQTPRLKNLGDKIDCFKLKYFGENPLDSPFFKEEIIGPVTPIFNIFNLNEKGNTAQKVDEKIFNLQELNRKLINSNQIVQDNESKSTDSSEQKEHLGFKILEDVIGQFNKSKDIQTAASEIGSTDKNETTTEENRTEKSNENKTESSVLSIITTPKYTIDLKPKHIYHQIELLEYLPNTSEKVSNSSNNSTDIPPNHRQEKSLDLESSTPAPTEELPPESQALRKRRRRPRPRPYYHVFDVNKFLPTRPYSHLNNYVQTSTMTPKYDASELHYRIKPSEQLTVFADIMNNIKNSSKDPHQLGASSDRIAVKLNLFDKYIKIPHTKNLDNIEETNSFYLTTSTTTVPPRGTVKFLTSKNKEFYDDDTEKFENLELFKVNKNRKRTTTTTTEPDYSDTKSAASNDEPEEEEEEESTSEVLGLLPPGTGDYKTLYNIKPIRHYEVIEETKINQFYVVGMKPPSPKQKTYIYSDYKIRPSVKKYSYLRRGKRSAQRPAYSKVVRNRNKPIDVQDDTEVSIEDDDDYVPHRPRNYHYDEKTGRIVYDNVKKEEEEEPEVEYVEVTEAPLPKPTRRNVVTTPKFEPYTGPSYIEFVKKLKNDPNYQAIPDPSTTEKGEEEATTSITTTTSKPVSTNPPEFLSILAKVRNSSNYKSIEDKTTKKATTTTEPPEEEEEEQESQLENVKNSPGGQSSGQNFQIFDISEYLPKVRNYSPRTTIDYSKYKTIERPSVSLRHNLSSRYNSDDSALEDVKTSKVPVLLEERKEEPAIETEINPIVSESKHEDVEPSTTTTTEATTTTRIRTRPKSRGSRRPTQRQSTSTTSRSIVAVSETETPPVHHDKPRRAYPRRRPTRIKVNRTTTTESNSEVEETTTRNVRRKHQTETDAPLDSERQIEEQIDATASEKNPRIVTPNEQVAGVNKTKPGNIEPRKIDHVQVFQQYDDSKKHGGNYKRESDSKEIKKVQVFQQYDETKKHGGNYKKENESKESKKVERLTDVIPKPSAFYTDPILPNKVNQLKEVEVAEEELQESKDEELTDAVEDYDDYEGEEEKTTTTKKPPIVKDPAKRLYYYAPI